MIQVWKWKSYRLKLLLASLTDQYDQLANPLSRLSWLANIFTMSRLQAERSEL